jgi:hypothetical protein
MAKTIGDGDKTDFDETRRLLYMAQLAQVTKRYNLAGTLVNALVHHHAVDGLDADEVGHHVVNVIEGTDSEEASGAWLREQIARITAELGD